MKIHFCSDLHLEFSYPEPVIPECDVLILPGDIVSGGDLTKFTFVNNFKGKIIYVAGNHEFYGYEFNPSLKNNGLIQKLKTRFKNHPNITFLENDYIKIDDVYFIGAVLWTDFNLTKQQKYNMDSAPIFMNDYRYIMNIKAADVLFAHQKSKKFIGSTIKKIRDNEPEAKIIVVTHHGCSTKSIHEYYKHTSGNSYFTSDLNKEILKWKPNYWIHGHTHQTINAFMGSTQIKTNPRGYVPGSPKLVQVYGYENRNYDDTLILEI